MKIRQVRQMERAFYGEHEQTGRVAAGSSGFANELACQHDRQSREQLTQLMTAITASGQRLGQMPTYHELKAYRELVRSFVAETVRRMYTLKTYAGWDRQGRHKVFTVIKQVDQELAHLTELVRQGEQNRLAILDKLDAIRGLLVDLYT